LNTQTANFLSSYTRRLADSIQQLNLDAVEKLTEAFRRVWEENHTVWICGNGGSAANAIHWANDFLYPVAKEKPRGIRIQALPSNASVLTCLGNDLGYHRVFAHQLQTFASAGDLLVVLSGSGNSPNVLEAIEMARSLGVESCAIVGFDGGKAKKLADLVIHCETDDMQIAEDLQMVVCHALVQALR